AEVARRVSGSPAGAMMHGPTFMGNPLACAIACANLDLLRERDAASLVTTVNAELTSGLEPARKLDSVVDVRTIGAVGVIELDTAVDVVRVSEAALDRGVWVRPFRNLVYTMPPYVSSTAEIRTITDALVGAVAEVHG
ncbi:MAG: aminotransferase class III-fold pyridoxal phosphate-dependent enzyme, partial [Marmoricola sp.]